jgi:hypothetical protein
MGYPWRTGFRYMWCTTRAPLTVLQSSYSYFLSSLTFLCSTLTLYINCERTLRCCLLEKTYYVCVHELSRVSPCNSNDPRPGSEAYVCH